RRRGRDAHARGDLGRLLRSLSYEAGDSPRTPPLPACGESTGGLRPPFLAQRTPMRSIGYGAKRAGEGAMHKPDTRRIDPHPTPPLSAGVGYIQLRPVNKWPNSRKPEFGCKRGEGADRVCGASLTPLRM